MSLRAIFVSIIFLSSSIYIECQANECDGLSEKVTSINNEISRLTPKTAVEAMAMTNPFNKSEKANQFNCANYDLFVAKAKLYRICYRELGYSKLRAEEYARQFDTDASTSAHDCSR